MPLRIDYGTLTMNTGTADASGSLWYVNAMDGWDSPDVRQDTADPTAADGASLLEGYYGARVVQLTGIIKSPSEAVFWASYNGFLGMSANLRSTLALKVYETTPKVVNVVRYGKPKIALQGSYAEFDIQFLATDPRKYEATATQVTINASNTQVITYNGNYSSFPTIVTSGASCQVLHVGNAQTFKATGLSGTSTFDHTKRTAVSGTTNIFQKITSDSQWITMVPGSNSITNQGPATVTFTYTNAWI